MLAPAASTTATRIPKPTPPANHGYRIGRVQRQVRRGFMLSDGRPLTTGELIRRAYPHLPTFRRWQYAQVREAARRWAKPIGRSCRGVIWAPTP